MSVSVGWRMVSLFIIKSLSGPLQITKGPNPESEDMDWLGDERTYGFDEAEHSTPEDYVKSFIDSINQSEVDGDSGYCTVVVDLKKKAVIAGGRTVQFNY